MKKIFYLFTASLVVLTSCSSDDDSSIITPSEDISILPKTISYIYPSTFLGTNSKSINTYSGNKILNIIDENSKTIYTYDGSIITKQEQFSLDEKGKETKSREVAYAYENGKLKTRIYKTGISEINPNGVYVSKTVYTYNSDGTISYILYSIDSKTQVETKQGTGKLTYKDGNLIKSEVNSDIYSFQNGVRTFEYDTKKNPLKNILGFSSLLDEVEDCGNNNVIKITRTRPDYPNPSVYLTTYIYNDNGYPAKHTSFAGDGKSIEYEIEYTY
jgi:hypothetical protein